MYFSRNVLFIRKYVYENGYSYILRLHFTPALFLFPYQLRSASFFFLFFKNYFIFGSAGLCLLCRLFLCGLLGVVALVVEQGHYGVRGSVAAACGIFPDQGSDLSPELAGRLLATEPPGKSCFLFFFCCCCCY